MERVATMKSIHTPIPSTYFLNLSQSYIYFSYPNQHRTCSKCGSKDHLGKSKCPSFSTITPWKRENVINLSPLDFPPLPKSQAQSDNKDSPLNVPNGTPTHTADTPDATLEKNPSNAPTVTSELDDLAPEKTPTDDQPPPDTPGVTLEKTLSIAPAVTLEQDDLTPMDQPPPLESTPSKTPTQMKNTSNAITEPRNQEFILEKNQPNAQIPDKSPSNATSVKTDQKFILETNPLNAHSLDKSPLNPSNEKTQPDHIPEKSPLYTHKLEKGLMYTDQNLTSFSPHLLRQTAARDKAHTYV